MDAYDASPPRRSPRGADPLDQRLDRWVSTGRQFVDGVVGARPGSRPAARPGERRGAGGPRLDGLGRWVEDRLDWLLEDGDDWREPWQEAAPPRRRTGPAEEPPLPPAPGPQRRGLEAVSRRGPAALPPRVSSAAPDDDWPDETSFSVPRWRRPPLAGSPPPETSPPEGPSPERSLPEVPLPQAPAGSGAVRPTGRPLPRSSRRR
jgi:hypothetical protein